MSADSEQLDRVLRRLDDAAPAAPAHPEMDPAAYYGLAGDVVRVIEPHTEADPVALLIQFLVAFGSIVGRGPHYRVESDQHHAALFAVLVGATARGRKGTSWSRIRAVMAGVDDPWARECVQGGLSSGEGLLHAVRDGSDDDPGVTDKRLLIVESEYAGLLRVMAREGNIVSRIVRDAWDRGDLRTMTRSCPLRATDAHVSIIGHITADELLRYLDRTEAANGFANRFIFVAARRSKALPHGGALHDGELALLSRRVAVAVARARQIGRVRMDDDAAARWEVVYERLSDGRPGMLGAVTARAEAQTIRLALCYALLDGSEFIRAEHLRAALAVWGYAEASARLVFGDSLGDPVADQILSAMREASADGLSRTQISALTGRNVPAHRIDGALRMLTAAGLAQGVTIKQGRGRPAQRWIAL